jgi:Mg-chelatase subunit ChlD
MRLALAALLVASTAAADPMLYEWNAATPRRPAEQLRLGACAIGATFHGAIVEFELRQKIANPTASELASAFEIGLVPSATLIGVAVDHASSIGVPVNPPAELRDSPDVLGADPAIAISLGSRYRVIMKPLASEREVTLSLRWTQVADIHDGTLHARVPGRPDGVSCVVTTKVESVPGATAKTPPMFTMSTDDAIIDVPIAIAGKAPIAWLSTTDLGDGKVARALTMLAPALRTDTGPRRALFVIDTSRSMELVGRGNVRRLVAAVASALPQGSELEAVLFDRSAERVMKGWAPNDAKTLAAIDQALAHHAAANGSDLGAAFALAHTALAAPNGPRNQAIVIAISDGVFGQISPEALAKQLGGSSETLDLYGLVVSPTGMTAPETGAGDALRVLTSTYGGSYLAETVDDLDRALADLASWLRPAWQDVALAGASLAVPTELRAGTGFTVLGVTPATARIGLKTRDKSAERPTRSAAEGGAKVNDKALAIVPAAVSAPIGALVLAQASRDDVAAGLEADHERAKLALKFPAADAEHDLVVLSSVGKVAAQRRQMIAAGGPYTRILEVADPAFDPAVPAAARTSTGGSSLDRTIIKRLLNDQLQPHAYSCYARALGRMVSLAGTATFEIEMGRGEVTRVTVGGFEKNGEFAGCLADAAYGIAPPLPTPGYNVDDRTIVTYALTFTMRDHKPEVAATGDAAVAPQGPPTAETARPRLDVDPSTPLGNVRPTP